MSAQIIPLPRPALRSLPRPAEYAWLSHAAATWMRRQPTRPLDQEAKEARIREIMASATPAPSMPGEADILKLLRRIDRKLSALSQETPHQKARIK